MKGKQAKFGKLLVALVLTALVMTSTFSAFALGATQTPVIARQVSTDIDYKAKIVPFGIVPPPERYQTHFSGSGAIENGDTAEPIRIVARKGGVALPSIASGIQGDRLLDEVADKLGISEEEIKSAVAVDTDVGKLTSARPVRIRSDSDIWSGHLTVGIGVLQETYFLVGKEQGSEIEFAVIPIGKYPVEINELVVEREVFPSIEIWKGYLGLSSESNFVGSWDVTAFSSGFVLRRVPVPLEIASGAEAVVDGYTIKTVEIKRQRLFGFIPTGNQQAIVEIYKDGQLVSKQTLTEDQTAVVGDLTLRVVKINGELKVVVETEATNR